MKKPFKQCLLCISLIALIVGCVTPNQKKAEPAPENKTPFSPTNAAPTTVTIIQTNECDWSRVADELYAKLKLHSTNEEDMEALFKRLYDKFAEKIAEKAAETIWENIFGKDESKKPQTFATCCEEIKQLMNGHATALKGTMAGLSTSNQVAISNQIQQERVVLYGQMQEGRSYLFSVMTNGFADIKKQIPEKRSWYDYENLIPAVISSFAIGTTLSYVVVVFLAKRLKLPLPFRSTI